MYIDTLTFACYLFSCAASKFLDQYYDYSLISQVGLIAAVSVSMCINAVYMYIDRRLCLSVEVS